MSIKCRYIKSKQKEFLKYTDHRMNGLERNAFEKNLQKEAFDEEAAEGFSSFTGKEIEKDLEYLSYQIKKRINKPYLIEWYRIAAAIAILVIVSMVFYTLLNNKLDKDTGQLILTESQESTTEGLPVDKPEDDIESDKAVNIAENKGKIPELKSDYRDSDEKIDVTDAGKVVEKDNVNQLEEASNQLIKSNSNKILTYYEDRVLKNKISDSHRILGVEQSSPDMKILNGIVLSVEDTVPLPGVNIRVKGTGMETVSDIRGQFKFPVTNDSSLILIASCSGLREKEITVEDNLRVRIDMESESHEKQELSNFEAVSKGEKKFTFHKVKAGQLKAVSSPPIPVVGYVGLNDYILKNQIYPPSVKIDSAIVILNFLINKNGRPDSITVVKTPGDEFSTEAIRLINNGPDWIPAWKEGKIVEEGVQVKIIFNIPEP